jgi:hypothetical protein
MKKKILCVKKNQWPFLRWWELWLLKAYKNVNQEPTFIVLCVCLFYWTYNLTLLIKKNGKWFHVLFNCNIKMKFHSRREHSIYTTVKWSHHYRNWSTFSSNFHVAVIIIWLQSKIIMLPQFCTWWPPCYNVGISNVYSLNRLICSLKHDDVTCAEGEREKKRREDSLELII